MEQLPFFSNVYTFDNFFLKGILPLELFVKGIFVFRLFSQRYFYLLEFFVKDILVKEKGVARGAKPPAKKNWEILS